MGKVATLEARIRHLEVTNEILQRALLALDLDMTVLIEDLELATDDGFELAIVRIGVEVVEGERHLTMEYR